MRRVGKASILHNGRKGLGIEASAAHTCSVDWLKRVALADRLFKASPVVRYEDFIASPMQIASRLLDATGIEVEPPDRDHAGAVRLSTNHILASNPDKFERGTLSIKPPDWSKVLRTRARLVVTASTLLIANTTTQVINPVALPNVGYDPLRDFTPVASEILDAPDEIPDASSRVDRADRRVRRADAHIRSAFTRFTTASCQDRPALHRI